MVATLGKWENNTKKFLGEPPVNFFENPLTLREIVYLYCNYADVLGYKTTELLLDEGFAYFTMLVHYELELKRALEFEIDINLLHDVEIKNPNTKNALKVQEYLRELVLYKDAIHNGISEYQPYYISKLKSIKTYINKWFLELESIDNINFKNRIKKIKNGHFRAKNKAKTK